MTTVKEIEKAIAELPPQKLSVLRAWFEKFDAAIWDKQIESDAKAGKFDAMAAKALDAYKNNKEGYFAFIILDINMPTMDGFTAAAAMRDWEKEPMPQFSKRSTKAITKSLH